MVPSSPINVQRNAATSTPIAIGFTWEDGASNGGSVVLDYQVLTDSGSNGSTFSIARTGITSRSIVIDNLVSG